MFEADEAALGLGELTTSSVMPCSGGRERGPLAGAALVDEGEIDTVVGRSLNGLGHPSDLGPVVGYWRV